MKELHVANESNINFGYIFFIDSKYQRTKNNKNNLLLLNTLSELLLEASAVSVVSCITNSELTVSGTGILYCSTFSFKVSVVSSTRLVTGKLTDKLTGIIRPVPSVRFNP